MQNGQLLPQTQQQEEQAQQPVVASPKYDETKFDLSPMLQQNVGTPSHSYNTRAKTLTSMQPLTNMEGDSR